jgi:hypothetical protein
MDRSSNLSTAPTRSMDAEAERGPFDAGAHLREGMTGASAAMDAPEIDGLWGLNGGTPPDRPFLVMPAGDQPAGSREFSVIAEDHFRYGPQPGIVLDLDRVRRDRGELRGELTVRCPRRAPARCGIQITADFSVGNMRSRTEWIRLLEQRTRFALLDFGPDHD